MAGWRSGCRSPGVCRTVFPDERRTPLAEDCGRFQAGASPVPSWACVRTPRRRFQLRHSSPIGPSPAPYPPGRAAAHRSGRPSRSSPPVPGRPAAVSALLLLGFLLVTWQVAVQGPLLRLDERLGRALTGRGPAWLAEFGADLGNLPVALPVLVAAMAYAAWRGRRVQALYAGVAMALVPAAVVPLKLLLARSGPLTDATGHYPSGHTATALVAYGAAALLVHRRALMPVAVVLAVATGIGLVLRGYHWPLDVAGSALLVTGVALGVGSLRLPRCGPPPRGAQAPGGPGR